MTRWNLSLTRVISRYLSPAIAYFAIQSHHPALALAFGIITWMAWKDTSTTNTTTTSRKGVRR